jgi:uncharacterized protein
MDSVNITGGIAGGLLIGIASVLLLAGSGRIAGISGILGGLYGKWTDTDLKWRLVFLLGLVGGTGLVSLFLGGLSQTLQANGQLLIIAGFLVGIGTRLGGGCTSGHGICGLSRRVKRSFVATLLFMGSAMITVYIIRHVLS